jgi:putative ABC transport system ATP-binding protein
VTARAMFLFQTESLGKDYRSGGGERVRALDEVSLTVERGSFTLLSGPSGAGKTTLLALLGALERPTRGRVLFDGTDLSGCSDAALARTRRRMGFVFQDFALIPNLSAAENITYPLIPRGVSAADRLRRAGDLLTRFGMGGKLTVAARELSGGEQQRVAVCRALAGGPEVLLADEPTSNLDAAVTATLLDTFQQLRAEGKTVVVSSHDPAVMAMATHVHALQGGKLMDEGVPGR